MDTLIQTLLETNTLLLVPPVLIAVNQVLIKVYNMPAKFSILVNQSLSITLVVLSTWGTVEPLKAILIGVLLGMASSGLYDVKKLFNQ